MSLIDRKQPSSSRLPPPVSTGNLNASLAVLGSDPAALTRVDLAHADVASHPLGAWELSAVQSTSEGGATAAALEIGRGVETLVVLGLSSFDGASGETHRAELVIPVLLHTVGERGGGAVELDLLAGRVDVSLGVDNEFGGCETITFGVEGGSLGAALVTVTDFLGAGWTADVVAGRVGLLAA